MDCLFENVTKYLITWIAKPTRYLLPLKSTLRTALLGSKPLILLVLGLAGIKAADSWVSVLTSLNLINFVPKITDILGMKQLL